MTTVADYLGRGDRWNYTSQFREGARLEIR